MMRALIQFATRLSTVYLACTLTASAIAVSGVVIYFGTNPSKFGNSLRASIPRHRAAHRIPAGHTNSLYTLSATSNSLDWSPMTSVVGDDKLPTQDVRRKENLIIVSREMVPPRLKLALTPDAVGEATAAASVTDSDNQSDIARRDSSKTLATRTDTDETLKHKLTDEQQLFNSYTGLRGFMAQSWINDNIGFQGGLAIPKEQIRDDQQSLKDQMAVGMGVLVNF